MSMKIHGVPPQLRRASLEPADQAKPEAPRAPSPQGLDRFEGLSGGERAEMQRFMNLKARAEAAPHGGGAACAPSARRPLRCWPIAKVVSRLSGLKRPSLATTSATTKSRNAMRSMIATPR